MITSLTKHLSTFSGSLFKNKSIDIFSFTTKRKNHQIPQYLKNVAQESNPNLAHMVQYYYHAAAQIMEESLIKELELKYPKMDENRRKARVAAILNLMGIVTASLEVTFPIIKTDGTYEIIRGYRAHHMKHRLPVKGGRERIY